MLKSTLRFLSFFLSGLPVLELSPFLISPVKKITYKINDKKKVKNLIIDGEIFGLNFKSNWKRNYKSPKKSFNNINIYNPKIEIQNIFKFENDKKFQGKTQISYLQDKLEYNILFNGDIINRKLINHKLSIPHKRMHNRNFVLFPLYELDKDWVHPKLNRNIVILMSNLTNEQLLGIKIAQ